MKRLSPSASSHHRPLGSSDPPGLPPSGPTSSEPLVSILSRHGPNRPLDSPPTIERPSASRSAGDTPASSQIVGARSTWETRAGLRAPEATPGPLAKNGTSAHSQ